MRKRNFVLAIATAVALTGLVGCTAAPSPAPSNSGAPKEHGVAAPAPLATIPTGTGIIAHTTMTSCDTTGTKVTAKGTVTMPKHEQGDVVISVSWVDSKNSSVYGRGVTTLKSISSGDKKEWTTTALLPAGARSVSCVLGAVIPK